MNHFSLKLHELLGGSRYEITLSGDSVRFLGSGRYEGKFRESIPVDQQKLERFQDALRLLELKEWNSEYICDSTDDGEHWEFEAEIEGTSIHSKGRNSYPTFGDPKKESEDRDRLELLIQATETCFYSRIPFALQRHKPAEPGASHNGGKPPRES
jgi:hypothetical protein